MANANTKNPFEINFILPPKTNNAIQIVSPSVKTGRFISSPAFQNEDSARPQNGSNYSREEASLFIPPRKMDTPQYTASSPSQTTVQTAPGETPEQGTLNPEPSALLSASDPRRPPRLQDSHQDAQATMLQPPLETSLDIYANNYIPMWQTAINESLAIPRDCSPLNTTDYATYINSFAGYRILGKVPPIRPPPTHTVPLRTGSSPEDLLPEQYGEYFRDGLQNEIAAQLQELKSFSMYNVKFEIEEPSQQLYRFRIPGLREHSPCVDLGDVVKIRPLIPAPPQPNFVDRQTNLQLSPRFSGFEFSAIVWGISKPQEWIILRMDGFMPNLPRACNVIFAVQEHRCASLWRSIELTARTLIDANNPSSPWLRRMLFPNKEDAKLQSTLSRGDFDLKLFDSQMNFEQQKSVDAVVTANYGCVPYLVCGSRALSPT